jgi:hypothetical protein
MFRTRYRLLVAFTPNSMEKIRKKTSRVSSVRRVALGMAAVLFVALPGTKARANVVSDWDAIAATTIVTNAHQPPAASAIWFAYMHLAVYDAVDSFDQRYQPYIFTTVPPAGASEDATAVAAAHRILVNYFPAQQASLDTQFSSSIGSISDTPANIAAGEAVGEASAQALIVARTGDGLLAVVPYTPPVGAGFWEPTPPAFAPPQTPWLGQMVPFTMTSADQFFPGGPDPLPSKNWIADYDGSDGSGFAGQHGPYSATNRNRSVLDRAHRTAVRACIPGSGYAGRPQHGGYRAHDGDAVDWRSRRPDRMFQRQVFFQLLAAGHGYRSGRWKSFVDSRSNVDAAVGDAAASRVPIGAWLRH